MPPIASLPNPLIVHDMGTRASISIGTCNWKYDT
jgi:hypothetical protein